MVTQGQRPLVSIVCIAFNHERFIAKTLDSFLEQRADFLFEVIVHDDASTDSTASIIREYAAKHPDVIVPILQNENQYAKDNKPWTICFPLARGKYIALCEGDDHWIDPLKLQKQVDALDADPLAAGCYMGAYNELAGVREPYFGGEVKVPDGTTLDLPTYLRGEGIPTCTFLFRRAMLKDPVGFIRGFATGDTALYTWLLIMGHFIFRSEPTGVRVKHAGGIHSLRSRVHHLRISVQNRARQDQVTGGRYKDILLARTHGNLRNAWSEALRENNMELGQLAWSHLSRDRAVMGWSRWASLWNGFRVYYPRLYAFIAVFVRPVKSAVRRLRSARRSSSRTAP